jgi:hypothetical protein
MEAYACPAALGADQQREAQRHRRDGRLVAVEGGEAGAEAAEEEVPAPAAAREEEERRRDGQVHHHFGAEGGDLDQRSEEREPGRGPPRVLPARPASRGLPQQERGPENPQDAEHADRPEGEPARERVGEVPEGRLDLDQVAVGQQPFPDARPEDEEVRLVDVEHAEDEAGQPQQHDGREERPRRREKPSHPVFGSATGRVSATRLTRSRQELPLRSEICPWSPSCAIQRSNSCRGR